MTVIGILYLASGLIFAAAAVLVLIRLVRGPSILDRMIASDVLLTTVILVLGVEMVIGGHTRTLPIALVLAGTAVFGSIAVARYVSKHDKSDRGTHAGPDGPAPDGESEAEAERAGAGDAATRGGE
jgi:multicomponent Na+:H+ antiporter subunit F